MDSPDSLLRCPYCWCELPKQIKHVEAFPHPFLRSQDNLFRQLHNIIRPRNTIEKEKICMNCGNKFSITFFTEIPDNIESKRIFDICHKVEENPKIKPIFENFLRIFFTKTKNCVNFLFGYEVYESSQTIFNFVAAFFLLFLPFFFYLFIKNPSNPLSNLSNFDWFLLIIILLTAVLLIELKTLIENNDLKLNLSTLRYGLDEKYVKSRWGKAFEECYLRGPTNEYIHIPFTNKLLSRPMFVGLLTPIPYLIYKIGIVEMILQQNPDYSLISSISIIPFYFVFFFIIGYSLSYSTIASPVIRVIARDIKLKIDLYDREDSYQILGELLGKSIMIFILITVIIATLIYGMYYSKSIGFNFSNIYEFGITLAWIILIWGITSWLWLSSLVDLKDKYQNVKEDYLISFKRQLRSIESKVEKSSDDIILINTLLFQIERILLKPTWPIKKPILLIIPPLVSPAILIFTKLREMGGV